MEIDTLTYLQNHLIKRVQTTTNIDQLVRLLVFMDELPLSVEQAKILFRPIRKHSNLEILLQEQNFSQTDWIKADALVKELNIQENTAALLAYLKE